MRSWHPIPPKKLDDKRLKAEHNELLIMARAIFKLNNGGYRRHPETNRWRGHSKAMKHRHDIIAQEMLNRGMNHKSPWPKECVDENDSDEYPGLIEPVEEMKRKLREKQGFA